MTDHLKVLEFHLRFGLPIADRPTHLGEDYARFRIARLREELAEYEAAVASRDLPGQADALVDLNYVSHGTAVSSGFPWQRVMDAVHAANLRKVRVARGEESRFGSRFDIIKPMGWEGPDVAAILRAAGWGDEA